jgi:hypothetical protein
MTNNNVKNKYNKYNKCNKYDGPILDQDSKPFHLTFRDSFIISFISASITVCIIALIYYIRGTPTDEQTYLSDFLINFASNFITQYFMEYSGMNDMLFNKALKHSINRY